MSYERYILRVKKMCYQKSIKRECVKVCHERVLSVFVSQGMGDLFVAVCFSYHLGKTNSSVSMSAFVISLRLVGARYCECFPPANSMIAPGGTSTDCLA